MLMFYRICLNYLLIYSLKEVKLLDIAKALPLHWGDRFPSLFGVTASLYPLIRGPLPASMDGFR